MVKAATANERLSGFYVSLPVTPGPDLAGYLDTLPHHDERAVPAHRLHTSLMYGADCPYPAHDPDSMERMQETKQNLVDCLAGLSIQGSTFGSDPFVLERFCNSVGVYVEPTEELQSAREQVLNVVQEGLGVSVESRDDWMHVSLLKPRPRRKDSLPVCYLSSAEMSVADEREPEVSIVATSWQDAEYLYALRNSARR